MLDAIIHKHLDKMDAIKEEINAKVDEIISQIDIDELINDPEGTLLAMAEVIKQEVVDPNAEKAVMLGEQVGKAIDKKDEILVDESNDPQKNKELVG